MWKMIKYVVAGLGILVGVSALFISNTAAGALALAIGIIGAVHFFPNEYKKEEPIKLAARQPIVPAKPLGVIKPARLEEREKYLEEYDLWLDENEVRYENEEDEAMDEAAFFAATDELLKWKKLQRKKRLRKLRNNKLK